MRRHGLYFFALGAFAFISLLMFTASVRADENPTANAVRNEDRGQKSKDVQRNVEDSRDITSSTDQAEQENATAATTSENEYGKSESETHRSAVATFVQNILKMSDKRNDGIGEQVREIAKAQEDSTSSTVEAIRETENRSNLKTFLFGADYKNIGTIRSAMAKTQNRITQLNRIIGAMSSSTEKSDFESQVNALEQQQTKLDDFVKSKENIFSLFGWFVKLFY